jgi:SAM-dependent methyltransferase
MMSVEEAAARWRRLIEERAAQTDALRTMEAGGAFWNQCAETFARSSRGFQGDRLLDLMLARLQPGMTVLDVGAGTGRYAVPLAKAGAQVIAVEPSEAMRGFLEQNAAEEGVTGSIAIVPEPWQDARVAPADLVLCSHVVYGLTEIMPFVEKLRSHARDSIFLAVRATQFDANVLNLWPRVYGEERRPEPSFIDLYNLLYAMGVAANVEIVPFGARRGRGPGAGFSSEDEALDSVRRILFAQPDAARDRIIRAFLAEHMEQRDGRWLWKGPGMKAALIWWTQERED